MPAERLRARRVGRRHEGLCEPLSPQPRTAQEGWPLPPAPIPPWHPSGLSRRCALSWTRCASTLSNTTRQVQEAKGRPHAFGDALVARIVQGHTDQREDHWLFEHQRRGKTNAMLLAACGCTPPAAGSCGLWSRHATRRQAARLWKALGTAPRTLIAIRWPWKDAQKAQKDHVIAGCERSGGGSRASWDVSLR